ncbi:MAG: hypothetical protein AAGK05_19730, partial [Pseudomonadota bacterium]
IKNIHSEIKKGIHTINKIFKKVQLKIAFTTFKTQHMSKNKDTITSAESSSLVYKYSCEHCDACYVGETRRQLKRRTKEHLTGRPPSEISMHVHPPSEQNFTILSKTKYTRITESLYLKKFTHEGKNIMNNNKTSEFLYLF